MAVASARRSAGAVTGFSFRPTGAAAAPARAAGGPTARLSPSAGLPAGDDVTVAALGGPAPYWIDYTTNAEGRLTAAGPDLTGSAFVYTAGGDRLIRREGGATANPAPPQVLDDFDRTVASGWGSADIGGAWTTTTPGKFAVNGQVGTMSVAAGATVKTWLGDLAWTSADVQATVSTDKAPAGSGPWVLVQARRVTDDLHYAARIKLNGDGTVGLHLTAGDGAAIAGGTVEGLTFTGGDRLRVRVQAEGTSPTTLRAKVWAEGDPEPAVWNVQTTDTTEGLQTAGTIGIRAYLPGSATNAPVGVLVDDLSATPVGAQAQAAATPTTTTAATTATTAVVGPSTTVYLPGGQELRLDQTTGKVTATRYYTFAGQTVAMRTGPGGTAVTSLVSDPHATATIAVANTTAATLTVRRFDPYANPRGPQVTWPGDHGFLDKPVDATGLVAIGARYYDPTLGRFISVDPVMDLTDPQQWAAYSYANNNPTTYSDPTGLIVCGDFEGAGACNRRHQSAGAGGGGGGGGDPRPAAPSPPVATGAGTSWWNTQRERFGAAATEAGSARASGHGWQYVRNLYLNHLAGVGNSLIDLANAFRPLPMQWTGVSMPHISPVGPYTNSARIAQDEGWIAGNVALTVGTGGAAATTRAGAQAASTTGRLGTAAGSGASAADIIQSTARAQAARGAEELAGALSPAERAAMQSQPWLEKPMLGQAVHRSTAGALDEAFPGRFQYSTRGPDFLDTLTGERLELTTPGQVGAHLRRPGYEGVTMCTYVLPGC